MQIAIIGGEGQLGSALMARLESEAVSFGHADLEITDPANIAARLDPGRFDRVIHCAAYNLVDRAETEPHTAFAVNALGTRNLALWCARHDLPLMSISTDYVFGEGVTGLRPLTETDVPVPVSVYGSSKLAGESFVRALCPRHWVVRTCGLYGTRATRAKGNFVETMLRLGRERPELKLVHDQRCTPTSCGDLAEQLIRLIRTTDYGVYHATNGGECTWYEFAKEIFRLTGHSPRLVPMTSQEYGASARRPVYSVLDSSRLIGVTKFPLRPWQEALADYLQQRESSRSS